MLAALCAAVGIPFRDEMLAWPKGPKSFDGVWARHWYDAVWSSTGFERQAQDSGARRCPTICAGSPTRPAPSTKRCERTAPGAARRLSRSHSRSSYAGLAPALDRAWTVCRDGSAVLRPGPDEPAAAARPRGGSSTSFSTRSSTLRSSDSSSRKAPLGGVQLILQLADRAQEIVAARRASPWRRSNS